MHPFWIKVLNSFQSKKKKKKMVEFSSETVKQEGCQPMMSVIPFFEVLSISQKVLWNKVHWWNDTCQCFYLTSHKYSV